MRVVSLSEGVQARVKRGVDGALAALDRQRSRYTHVQVETPDGACGFALFGGWTPRHLFRRLYLQDFPLCRTRVIVHHRATPDLCHDLARRFGLVIFCGDCAPPGMSFELLKIPAWLDMERTLPDVLEGPGSGWCRSVREDIRKVRQQRYHYDVVSADKELSRFYTTMFRPSIIGRHGPEAYLGTRRMMMALGQAEGAELLRVFQGRRWVAASLNHSTLDSYRLLRLGWIDGDAELLRNGVVGAVYWFNLQRARALGHRRLHFGAVRPLLEDGLLSYKEKWGGELCATPRSLGEFHLLIDPSHPTCQCFLRKYSLVTRAADGAFIVLSGHDPAAARAIPYVMRNISRWYQWGERPLPSTSCAEIPQNIRPWLRLRQMPAYISLKRVHQVNQLSAN